MKILKIGKFTFVCERKSNRSGFKHECTMFNEQNCELAFTKAQYYNRTRESRCYQSVVLNCIREYKHEKIERMIDYFKYENNLSRLPKGKRDELTAEFEQSELGKQLAECRELAKNNYYN